jgi:hypothetical protein
MGLENKGQPISRDLFRVDEIRLLFDAPEPWAASHDKILLRLLKELGAKSGHTSGSRGFEREYHQESVV